jgi:hypothetical protein
VMLIMRPLDEYDLAGTSCPAPPDAREAVGPVDEGKPKGTVGGDIG